VITEAFLALCVLLALVPPRRGGVTGFLIFICGFLASQVPFLALYYIGLGVRVRQHGPGWLPRFP
jgi:hypothetical protein